MKCRAKLVRWGLIPFTFVSQNPNPEFFFVTMNCFHLCVKDAVNTSLTRVKWH